MKRYLLSAVFVLSALLWAPAAIAAQMQDPHHPAAAADNTQSRYQEFRQAQDQQREKTAPLRRMVRQKKHELAALWLSPNAGQEDLLKKQRELQDARAALEREQLAFKFRMKQQGFDFDHYGMRDGYGMRGGHDMGHGMGSGTGHGMMGCGMRGGMHPGMMGQGMMGGSMDSGATDGPMGTGAIGNMEPDMMMEEGWW